MPLMLKAISTLVSPKTSKRLETVRENLRQASARLEAAKILTQKADALINQAAKAVYAKFAYTNQIQGANLAEDQGGQEECVRNITYYLRMITYCLVAGSTGPLDEHLIAGTDETNHSSDLPPNLDVEALKYIKANHGLSGDAAIEANFYIDYAIKALS